MKIIDIIIIAVIVAALVVSIIFTVKRKKKGGCCGCGKDDCPYKKAKKETGKGCGNDKNGGV